MPLWFFYLYQDFPFFRISIHSRLYDKNITDAPAIVFILKDARFERRKILGVQKWSISE